LTRILAILQVTLPLYRNLAAFETWIVQLYPCPPTRTTGLRLKGFFFFFFAAAAAAAAEEEGS